MNAVDNPRCAHCEREAGFTLVELLVALALFSLLTTALFGSLHFGVKAWIYGTVHAERIDQNIHTREFLRRALENAYPLFHNKDMARQHVDFDGTESSLTFLTPSPTALAAGGYLRLVLSVTRQDRHAEVVMTTRHELATQNETAPSVQTLLSGAQGVKFAYFGIPKIGGVAEWHSQWKYETALPALIRIDVRFAANDPRTWPTLFIAPRLGADASCVHDPLTNRCRGR